MFSDESSEDSLLVARRSILRYPDRPWSAYFAEYLRDTCGVNTPKKHIFNREINEGLFVACVRCPPVATRDDHGLITLHEGICAACRGTSKEQTQAEATRRVLEKLFDVGALNEYTGNASDAVQRAYLQCDGWDRPVDLYMPSGDESKYPDATLPDGHQLHYIVSMKDLPKDAMTVGKLLLPHNHEHRAAEDKTARIIGFDIEWRPQLGGNPERYMFKPSHVSPVSVVQLSSYHATVVVNLCALGEELEPDQTVWSKCRAALAVVADVLGDEKLQKVGLQCEEDIIRIKALNKTMSCKNVSNCQDDARKLGFQRLGVRALMAAVCGQQVMKGEQTADWQQKELRESMIQYAALDAWCTRQVYIGLQALKVWLGLPFVLRTVIPGTTLCVKNSDSWGYPLC
jgi:ribonuclease D